MIETMNNFTYRLTFDNGQKFQTTTSSLDEAHAKIVKHMTKHNLNECLIACPNGTIRRVKKTGESHWNHPGFSFD
jgi:NAD-dependent dihydropyrimidine dehydrogenase PreA subunit